jgi:hypothetical protein
MANLSNINNKFLVTTGGNVGINTTSPDSKLDVTGGDITVNTTATGFMNFKYSGSQMGTIGTDGVDLKITANADLQILPTGNVGIDNISPSGKLHIGSGSSLAISGSADELILDGAGNSGMTIGSGTSSVGSVFFADSGSSAAGYVQYNHSSNALIIGTEATERMRIDSSGNVGIGTSNPQTDLHIAQSVNNTPTILRLENADQTIETNQEVNTIQFYTNDTSTAGTGITSKISQIAENAGNEYAMAFYTYNSSDLLTQRMRITNTGYVGIGNTSGAGARTKLGVTFGVTGNAANLAESVSYAAIEMYPYRNSSTYGMFVGPMGLTSGYIQSANANGTAAGAFSINPWGGNVGIGTTSPSRGPLHINENSSGYCQVHLTNDTSGTTSGDGLTLFTNGADAGLMQRENSYLLFGTNNTERMRITNGGNVVINYNATGGVVDPLYSKFTVATQPPYNLANSQINPTTATFFSDKMTNNGYNSILQLVSVRTSLTSGQFSNGYLGFSTLDNSNGQGVIDAGRIAIVNEVGQARNSATALSFWTNTPNGNVSNTPATEKMRITSGGNVGIGVTPTQKLDVNGQMTHDGLVLKTGTSVYIDTIQTIDKTLSITGGVWTNTGIEGTDIGANGSYMIQVYSNAHGTTGGAWYSMYWTGVMSWYKDSSNGINASEIYLNFSGHALNNNVLQLRTLQHTSSGTPANLMSLQIKTSNTLTNAPISFRFRRLM